MSKLPLTAGEVAIADQCQAGASADLGRLVKAVRSGDERSGEAQNLANFITYLKSKHSPAYLAAMLVIACRRIGDGT